MFGYSCGNDFTARDAQQRVSQWMTGKTPDQFAPLGPWLVTADQIPDLQTLSIQTFVNDEPTPRQDMNAFTGTPSGVITGYPKEKQVWLKAGDRIRTTITKLGDLKFTLT